MSSPEPSDKEEYAFWCREKAAADLSKSDLDSYEWMQEQTRICQNMKIIGL